jgi:hypothetical protein
MLRAFGGGRADLPEGHSAWRGRRDTTRDTNWRPPEPCDEQNDHFVAQLPSHGPRPSTTALPRRSRPTEHGHDRREIPPGSLILLHGRHAHSGVEVGNEPHALTDPTVWDRKRPTADVHAADQLFAGALMLVLWHLPPGALAGVGQGGGGDVVQLVKRPWSTGSAAPRVLMSRALSGAQPRPRSTQVYS